MCHNYVRLLTAVRALSVACLILIVTGTAQSALLVGTIVTSGVETIAEMNDLIDDYNADFGASLPHVGALLDKLEGQDSADFIEGNLALGDFDFYHSDDSGATNVNVFDSVVTFTPSTLGPAAGFDTLDNRVFAFEQLSGPSFDYYVSKDGNLGWSLWIPSSGINPVYTDAGTGASSIVGSGFTRGDTANNALDFDPITNGVSHISFYNASLPEPNSALLLAVATLLMSVVRRRS